MSWQIGLQLAFSGLSVGSIYALVALALVIILATLAVVALLTLFFRNARFGKAMRAVALDQTAARLMGIGVGSVFASAWALSAAIGALAGLLLAPVIGITPEIGHLILKG